MGPRRHFRTWVIRILFFFKCSRLLIVLNVLIEIDYWLATYGWLNILKNWNLLRSLKQLHFITIQHHPKIFKRKYSLYRNGLELTYRTLYAAYLHKTDKPSYYFCLLEHFPSHFPHENNVGCIYTLDPLSFSHKNIQNIVVIIMYIPDSHIQPQSMGS